jgi:undecaprenyl-diphosphatase
MDLILRTDSAILLWIQENIRNEFLTPVVRFITHLGDKGILWIVLILFLMCFKKTRKSAFLASSVLLLTFIVTNLYLKPFIARIRPYEVIDNLTILIPKQSDFSFPSGHTANSLAVGITLWYIGIGRKKSGIGNLYFPKSAGWTVFILSVLISLSRLYLGVHYPTDVLGGAVIASVISFICILLYKKIFSDKN